MRTRSKRGSFHGLSSGVRAGGGCGKRGVSAILPVCGTDEPTALPSQGLSSLDCGTNTRTGTCTCNKKVATPLDRPEEQLGTQYCCGRKESDTGLQRSVYVLCSSFALSIGRKQQRKRDAHIEQTVVTERQTAPFILILATRRKLCCKGKKCN